MEFLRILLIKARQRIPNSTFQITNELVLIQEVSFNIIAGNVPVNNIFNDHQLLEGSSVGGGLV
jgi:hypothetical protein